MQKLAVLLTTIIFLSPLISSAQSVTCPSITSFLTVGAKHPQVIVLKKFLGAEGLLKGVSNTSYFGPSTAAALKTWQRKQGIEATGATGPKTRGALKNCTTPVAVRPTVPTFISPRTPVTSTCASSSESRTQSCPDGQTGGKVESRSYSCTNSTWSVWTTTMNTCGAGTTTTTAPTPSWTTGAWSSCTNGTQTRTVTCAVSTATVTDSLCTATKPVVTQACSTTSIVCTLPSPATETRTTTTCPAGQVGITTENRTASCPANATAPVWSAWEKGSSTCSVAVVTTLGSRTVCEKPTVPIFMTLLDERALTEGDYKRIASCANPLILDSNYKQGSSSTSARNFSAVVSKIKSYGYGTKVYVYSWGTFGIGWHVSGQDIDYTTTTIGTYLISPALLSVNAGWNVDSYLNTKLAQKTVYQNPGNTEYRAAMISRYTSTVDEVGADGLLLDVMFPYPTYGGNPARTWCYAHSVACTQYKTDLYAFLGQIKAALGSKALIFNGISGNFISEGKQFDLNPQLNAQTLQYTDGATIEHFGSLHSKAVDMQKDIMQYVEIAKQNPTKKVYFYGREPYTDSGSPQPLFATATEALKHGVYLYGLSLVFKEPNTSFQYVGTFVVPGSFDTSAHSRGDTVLKEQLYDIGAPVGAHYEHGNFLLTRYFTNGFVAVAKDIGNPDAEANFSVPEGYFDVNGKKYTAAKNETLKQGEALILFYKLNEE
jgi:Putative peptidoglycan binding domain/Hypothetical glycosyl hydrolase family 15/Thrombospondin type 1 domain